MQTITKSILYDIELDNIKQILSDCFPFKTNNFGKMVRSRLGILFSKSLNITLTKDVILFLAVIELIHNASLFHDDVIDNEHCRRKPDKVNNSKKALIYGNLLMCQGIDLLLKNNLLSLVSLVTSVISDMCKGELLQQSNLFKIAAFSEYIEKTYLKTASLFVAIFEGVNILQNNSIPRRYKEFFKCFGMAYQIKNDLDNFRESRSDINNGIYTLPIIYTGSINITEDSLEKTISLIDNYKEEGIKVLSDIKDSPYKEELIGIVECLKS